MLARLCCLLMFVSALLLSACQKESSSPRAAGTTPQKDTLTSNRVNPWKSAKNNTGVATEAKGDDTEEPIILQEMAWAKHSDAVPARCYDEEIVTQQAFQSRGVLSLDEVTHGVSNSFTLTHSDGSPYMEIDYATDSLTVGDSTYGMIEVVMDTTKVARHGFDPKAYQFEFDVEFEVCAVTDSTYEVLINERDTRFIAKSEETAFKTWQEYLINSIGVLGRSLRSAPHDSATTIPFGDHCLSFRVDSLAGEWLLGTCSTTCFGYDESVQGWIHWYRDEQVSIQILKRC